MEYLDIVDDNNHLIGKRKGENYTFIKIKYMPQVIETLEKRLQI